MAQKTNFQVERPFERRDHPLWAEDSCVFELARLTAIVMSFQRTDRDPIGRLANEITDHAQKAGLALPDDGPYYNEVYRLVSFSHITHKARVLDAIADYVTGQFTELKQKKQRSKYLKHALAIIDLPRAFNDYKLNKLIRPAAANYAISSETNPQTPNFPKVYTDQFNDASAYLTGISRAKDAERDSFQAHYACFRYSVIVGNIAKSHFNFLPCSESDPICRFENSFREKRGGWRNSSGLAFIVNGWVYLVGQLRREHAIKVLAARATGQMAPPIMPALLLSKSVKPLVARAVLQRLAEPLQDNEIRIADERTDSEFSSAEFRNSILPHIRNGMEFQLEEQIVFSDENGKAIEYSQAEMVQMLPRLIRGSFSLRDKDGKLRPFNPAAHDHYPFNQAIFTEDE